MITRLFHHWERRLHRVTPDRIVRPFEWGLEWLPPAARRGEGSPAAVIGAYARTAVAESEAFYAATPAPHYALDAQNHLTFESAAATPHPVNNIVHARYFPAVARTRPRAVLVLPHWNADETGYVGLCQILARFGVSALRLTLPYHERRMPSELHRADYIVSANVGRTLMVNRQAVVDARRAIWWLANRGYDAVGILGTSLGSCLSMLTACHEPLVRAAALNHVSPFFADVVWEGLSTVHVRAGLDGHIHLPTLRRLWLPISPQPFVDRIRDTRTLLVYARYDLTFPLHLSRELVHEFRARAIPHQVVALPCGHYSTGMTPFKYLDGYVLTKFLLKAL
ncbi:MAG: abhydrolase domain-containing 18 [Luteitalea sp.]|nr:abhydrolase domain-containing 18 [Luteitalea sp.]